MAVHVSLQQLGTCHTLGNKCLQTLCSKVTSDANLGYIRSFVLLLLNTKVSATPFFLQKSREAIANIVAVVPTSLYKKPRIHHYTTVTALATFMFLLLLVYQLPCILYTCRIALLFNNPCLPLIQDRTGSWSEEWRMVATPSWSSPETGPLVMTETETLRYCDTTVHY